MPGTGRRRRARQFWESTPRTVAYDDAAFHRKQFRPRGVVHLQPGRQYVIFASISKDYAECSDGYALQYGAVPDGTYPDGTLVFLNNGGDASNWTTENWTSGYNLDLVFKAWLS